MVPCQAWRHTCRKRDTKPVWIGIPPYPVPFCRRGGRGVGAEGGPQRSSVSMIVLRWRKIIPVFSGAFSGSSSYPSIKVSRRVRSKGAWE